MTERFVTLAEFISPILLENKLAPDMLTAIELDSAREFLNVLKPFEIATKIVCGEKYLTTSKIIPVVGIIREKLTAFNSQSKSAKQLKSNAMNNFNSRFLYLQLDTKLVIATLLDPRYKKLYITNQKNLEVAINSIQSELQYFDDGNSSDKENDNTYNDKDDEEDFWSHHRNLVQESTQNFSHNNQNTEF